jgi:hypothetical protein
MESVIAVDIEHRRPQELRELSRGAPPHEVHLEEAFLSMDESESGGEVETIFRSNRGNAARVAIYLHGSRESFEDPIAIEVGKASRELAVTPERSDTEANEEEQDERKENVPRADPHGRGSYQLGRSAASAMTLG